MNRPPPHSERLARFLLEHLSSAVLYVDDGLVVRYLNPAAEDLLAVSARQVAGSAFLDLLQNAGPLAERLPQALATGAHYTERELVLALGTGRRITVDCTVSPLHDADAPSGLLLELVSIDRHLRISREETLLAQREASRAVVRGLAHEIKNPLGGLRGAAQLLGRELAGSALADYTTVITDEADRLRTLVDALLGPIRPSRDEAVNIHQVLEHVRTLVVAEAPAGLTVRGDYDPSIPELRGDRDQLIQAVLNVMRNAAQAVDEQARAGRPAEIILRTRTQRQFTIGHRRHRLVVRVDVEDNGPGVPEEVRERIFYPMVTGRASGSGMGLSIAQELVNRQGGLIECDTAPGGTSFSIYLPLSGDHAGGERT